MTILLQTMFAILLSLAPLTVLYAEETHHALLYEALQTALSNNDRIKNAQATLLAAQERIIQSRANLLPNVAMELSGNYGYTRWQGGDSNSDPDSLSFSVTQKLFDLKTLKTIQQTYPYIAAVEKTLQHVSQQVIFQVIEETIGVLQANKVIALAKENRDVTQRHLQATQIRQEVGELTRTELSRAQARFSSAEADHIKAEFQALVAQARFEEVVGAPIKAGLALPKLKMALLNQSNETLLPMINSRPDIAAAQFQLLEAKKNAETLKATHYPVINLSSSASRTWDLESTSQPGTNDNLAFELALTVPLYTGGYTTSITDEAQFQERAQQAELDRLRKQAVQEIKQAVLDLKGALVQEKSLLTGVTASRDALNGIREEFKAGTRTSLDLLDAQHELFTIQTDQVKNQFAIIIAQFKLLKSVGQLSLENRELSQALKALKNIPPTKTQPANGSTNKSTGTLEKPAKSRPTDAIREPNLTIASISQNLALLFPNGIPQSKLQTVPPPPIRPAARPAARPVTKATLTPLIRHHAHQPNIQAKPRVHKTLPASIQPVIKPHKKPINGEPHQPHQTEAKWTIQVEANLSHQVAKQHLAEIQQNCGCQPYLQTLTDTQSHAWHMIRFGQYNTKTEAKINIALFRNKTGMNAYSAPLNSF